MLWVGEIGTTPAPQYLLHDDCDDWGMRLKGKTLFWREKQYFDDKPIFWCKNHHFDKKNYILMKKTIYCQEKIHLMGKSIKIVPAFKVWTKLTSKALGVAELISRGKSGLEVQFRNHFSLKASFSFTHKKVREQNQMKMYILNFLTNKYFVKACLGLMWQNMFIWFTNVKFDLHFQEKSDFLQMFFIISPQKGMVLLLEAPRQPTHRSSLLEMFCYLSTPYYYKGRQAGR